MEALTKAKPEATANTAQISRPVINGFGLSVEFSTDRETGEVIRQLPPKELVAFLRQFQKNGELSTGLLLSLWS